MNEQTVPNAMTDEDRAYNRGWQDGNATALDACNPIIERLQTALRVAAHSPHDQAGEPVEGFPVCSVCGAIQTKVTGETELRAALDAALDRGIRAVRELVRWYPDKSLGGSHEQTVLRSLLDLHAAAAPSPVTEGAAGPTLDAAWKTVEAGLPEGWTFRMARHADKMVEAVALPPYLSPEPRPSAIIATDIDPARALQALAARLGAPDSGETR